MGPKWAKDLTKIPQKTKSKHKKMGIFVGTLFKIFLILRSGALLTLEEISLPGFEEL